MNEKVAIALVGNFKFLRKHFVRIFFEIRNIGKYNGPIVVITTKLCPTFLIKFLNKKNNICILRFRKIKFSKKTELILNNLETYQEPNRNKTKKFQWHKLHLFDERLKNWDKIFYLDINMNIHFELEKILNIKTKNKLLARADSFPSYDRELATQFDSTNKIYSILSNKYDLNISNYFQTGIMYFDTEIITSNTKKDILKIVERFPISTTNEQGILNLYFIFHINKYEELPPKVDEFTTYFYWKETNKKTIITKQNTPQFK